MKKGFTILEMLVVIMVIAILIGIALPRFKGMQDEGNIAKAKGELRTLQIAVESYYIHHGNTYPATGSEALGPLLSAARPNIITAVPADPLNSTGAGYMYVMGGTGNKYYILYSVGPGGNGIATITNDAVVETNSASCIYASNISQDTVP